MRKRTYTLQLTKDEARLLCLKLDYAAREFELACKAEDKALAAGEDFAQRPTDPTYAAWKANAATLARIAKVFAA